MTAEQREELGKVAKQRQELFRSLAGMSLSELGQLIDTGMFNDFLVAYAMVAARDGGYTDEGELDGVERQMFEALETYNAVEAVEEYRCMTGQ